MNENLFENCVTSKRSNIRVKNLQKYAMKCEQILYGCDEMKLISQDDVLSNCPCFQKIVYNGTNSKDVLLDCNEFQNCIFDSISVTLDVYETCLLYKVMAVYDWNVYDLVDFRFFSLNSQKVKVNGYMSDILIHWKAWRLQVVSWWKFNIYDFLTDLVTYECKERSRFLIALESYYITRFDFRIDFFHSNDVKHLNYEDVFTQNARKSFDSLVIDRKSKKLYTWRTCWNRKDKYIYTRMYQKQIEALDKWLGDLYYDYVNYNWKVWRLEFEFLSKFTTYPEKVSFSDEYLNHELTKKIFQYIWLSEKNWYFSKPKNKIEVPFVSLSLYKKKRLITQTMNNVVKLYKGWINPYIIVNQALIENDSLFKDNQVLHYFYEDSIYWDSETYDELISKIQKSSSSSRKIYDNIYKNQLWIDI